VALATVAHDELQSSRAALSSFYGGEALHAAPMYQRAEYESLRLATGLASDNNDGMDIVICAPIAHEETRDQVRRRCLSAAVAKAHTDFGATAFVIDRLSTPPECAEDMRTIADMRKSGDGRLPRDAQAIHARPSEELLLGLPDILAWSYRQLHARQNGEWFEPFRDYCEVTVL
jgi:hypothetical protein